MSPARPLTGGEEKGVRPRRGRPPAAAAGDVERRILDAASTLFLERGFARTTLDHVAETAQTGKTTLYGRFATKELLFAAVVARDTQSLTARIGAPQYDGPKQSRLEQAGIELADITLTKDSIALMRVTSADAETFPGLAQEGFRIGFSECARYIAHALADDDSDAALAAVSEAARRFVELALHPLYMHAFFGADLAGLRARARIAVPQVAPVVIEMLPK
ncbi:TetR/AcrR family transcriptional regulator [Rhodococcus sp. EPR-157]|uniref:TetR/AcrR family transcriptional regulator n=1 Tax=Rhodococcus sp. EPR-157 TaxID=1813677 RepID=UPI000B2082BB|nr:helix-turn-helix domain-containing protein [Rhodococcus sp. EPR-157]